jgi:hypothetical protein
MSSSSSCSEFRIYCRSTTGVVELYQPDEETSQEILVLADSSMLKRSLPADTVKSCIKSYALDVKLKIDSKMDYIQLPMRQ